MFLLPSKQVVGWLQCKFVVLFLWALAACSQYQILIVLTFRSTDGAEEVLWRHQRAVFKFCHGLKQLQLGIDKTFSLSSPFATQNWWPSKHWDSRQFTWIDTEWRIIKLIIKDVLCFIVCANIVGIFCGQIYTCMWMPI